MWFSSSYSRTHDSLSEWTKWSSSGTLKIGLRDGDTLARAHLVGTGGANGGIEPKFVVVAVPLIGSNVVWYVTCFPGAITFSTETIRGGDLYLSGEALPPA